MGIKGYLSNLLAMSPNILGRQVISPDILCIDVNTLLHETCRSSKNREEFKVGLFDRFDKLVNKIKPQHLAIFADGQAALAKAEVQIKRRTKHLYDPPSKSIDTLNLTPGTPFMDFVDEVITEYLSGLEIKTTYSSSKELNEGELKLFEWLRDDSRSNSKICIVGNDADLIVLSLLNTPLLHVSIYNNKQVISLFQLVKSLADLCELRFNFRYHPVRRDVGLISLLSGNDYLDHLVNFREGMRAYKTFLAKKRGFLFDKKGDLHISNMREFLSNIKIIDQSTYSPRDAREYFRSIIWNLKLYTGETVPNYLPRYKGINLATVMQYFPREVNLPLFRPKWQYSDVYLLLLMPITGRDLLPERLKPYMEDSSSIRDLFPDPCGDCINFKKQINLLNGQMDTLEEKEYKLLSASLNKDYKDHIMLYHQIKDLPIERIFSVLKRDGVISW